MPIGIQFDQFNVGGALETGDIVVGLRNNQNYQFTFAPFIDWTVISTNTSMSVDAGYIVAGTGTVQLLLPTTIAAGQMIRVAGTNVSQWQVTQGNNQYIYLGDMVTTTGPAGYLESTKNTDCIELLCINANIGFIVLSAMGNITVN